MDSDNEQAIWYLAVIAAAQADTPELPLVDLGLGTRSGLDVVRAVKALDPTTIIVVLTGYGSIVTAVESIGFASIAEFQRKLSKDPVPEGR